MRQIILKSAGNIENLQIVKASKPSINENEVLVKIVSLNIDPVYYKSRSNENILSFLFGSERPVISLNPYSTRN